MDSEKRSCDAEKQYGKHIDEVKSLGQHINQHKKD